MCLSFMFIKFVSYKSYCSFFPQILCLTLEYLFECVLKCQVHNKVTLPVEFKQRSKSFSCMVQGKRCSLQFNEQEERTTDILQNMSSLKQRRVVSIHMAEGQPEAAVSSKFDMSCLIPQIWGNCLILSSMISLFGLI